MSQEILDGLFEHVFLNRSADLHAVRNAGRKFDKFVIEEGYAAFDGAGHAHLILLHQKLDQVRFLIRIEQLLELG